MQSDRDVICDRAMGSVFVVVPSPNLQFYLQIRKAHEVAIVAPLVQVRMATRVQAFRPELAVERLDEAIVRGLAKT